VRETIVFVHPLAVGQASVFCYACDCFIKKMQPMYSLTLFWLVILSFWFTRQIQSMSSFGNEINDNIGTGRKWVITMEEKMEWIMQKRLKNPSTLIFDLTTKELSLFLSYPRNYTMVTLMYLKDEKYPCPECLVAYHALQDLALQYLKQQPNANIIFTKINYFNNAKEAFEAVFSTFSFYSTLEV
jgi:OST3 / OST6 family, transporter family